MEAGPPTPADLTETLSALSVLRYGSFTESEECTNPLPNINLILRQLKQQRRLAGLDADEKYDKIIIHEEQEESIDEDEPEDKTGYKQAWVYYQSKRKWKTSWIKEEETPDVKIEDQND